MLEQQAAELTRSNRDLEQFAYVASHDLQEPLRKVASFCQLLQRRYSGQLDERADQYIGFAVDGAKRMQDLINDLLSFSRVGRLGEPPVEVAVADLVADAEALIAPQIRNKGLHYSCKGCDADLYVRADAEKARQVVLNLLSNAVKFTDPGGAITVTCEATDHAIIVRVIDTGRGVPADKLDRIFEPFVQVDRGLTRSTEGTGLGLSISLDLARSMGGNLTASSVLGQGSTFIFTLPRGVRGEVGAGKA
jgi:signal transduction histidine kinase